MNSIHIIDLFCGAGGFAYGFKLASPRFHIDLAIDINKWASKTYEKNFPSSRVIRQDITDLQYERYVNSLIACISLYYCLPNKHTAPCVNPPTLWK